MNKAIDDYSKDELEEALARKEAEERPKPKSPSITNFPQFKKIVKACEEYLDDIENGRVDSDASHYVFEAAMDTVYGNEVWQWVNKKT